MEMNKNNSLLLLLTFFSPLSSALISLHRGCTRCPSEPNTHQRTIAPTRPPISIPEDIGPPYNPNSIRDTTPRFAFKSPRDPILSSMKQGRNYFEQASRKGRQTYSIQRAPKETIKMKLIPE